MDIKQLIIPSNLKEASVPFFVFGNSIVSGILWNVAFGKIGNLILKTIEWEGRENIEGELEKEGILTTHPYIKGLLFTWYENLKSRKLRRLFQKHGRMDSDHKIHL
ncbi:MAG: hypothetical protein IPH16_14425 [Haliscomenobacter sp.]|nr:hypothetical protein [Haliscomenobacter sp.]